MGGAWKGYFGDEEEWWGKVDGVSGAGSQGGGRVWEGGGTRGGEDQEGSEEVLA